MGQDLERRKGDDGLEVERRQTPEEESPQCEGHAGAGLGAVGPRSGP